MDLFDGYNHPYLQEQYNNHKENKELYKKKQLIERYNKNYNTLINNSKSNYNDIVKYHNERRLLKNTENFCETKKINNTYKIKPRWINNCKNDICDCRERLNKELYYILLTLDEYINIYPINDNKKKIKYYYK